MKRILSMLVALVMVLTMLPVMSFASETRTVYLDPANGLDTNSGLTESAPVKTVAVAYEALAGADSGKVVFLSTLTLTALTNFPVCSIPVTLTSKTGAEGITASENVYFRGPTTLEKMTFTSKASNNYTLMSAGGHKFTIGENVTTVNAGSYPFGLCGGSNFSDCTSVDLTVKSGTWQNIYIAAHGVRTVDGDCLVDLDGITLNGFLSAGRQSVVTGDVTVSVKNSVIPTVYACASQTTGRVDGDITITLGAGAQVTNYTIESNSMSVVGGTNTLILDGGSVSAVKKSSENTASGATAVVLKSGRIDTCQNAADTVSVNVESGKNLTIGGQLDVDSLQCAGTLTFTGEATLTAAAVTGSVNCLVEEEALSDHLYVSAPVSSNIRFDASTGILGVDGQWTVGGTSAEENFVGLILTAEPDVTVTLYKGVAEEGRQSVSPTKTVSGASNYYYFENVSGYYHYVASATGSYKIQKNIYISKTEAAGMTILDVTPPKLSGEGWEQTTNVKLYTDEIQATVRNDDPAQWPEYADIFTTPYFTEERTAYQMTTQDQMEEFIDKLDDENDNLYVYNAGYSTTYKFSIDAIVVTKSDLSGAVTLEDAAAKLDHTKPTIFYRTHVHGSEPASGEAALAMLQRLDGTLGEKVLDKVNVVIVPRNSPDAAYNYTRYLEDGTELNQNLMNADYAETEAYLRVYYLFNPEVVLDGHEFLAPTMGSYIEYDDAQLGLGFTPHNSTEFQEAYRPMTEKVLQELTDNGLKYRFYSDLVATNGAASGSRSHSSLQGNMFVLVETHGIGNGTEGYHRRVVSQVVCIQTMMEYIAENAGTIRDVVHAERQRIIDLGKTYDEADQLILAMEKLEDESWAHPAIHVYQSGSIVNETIVPYVRKVTKTRTAPTAYVIPAGNDYIADILALMDKHNIQYQYIPAGAVVELQQYSGTITDSTVTDVTLSTEMPITFGSGAYVFCKNQVMSNILSAFMEPDISASVKSCLVFRGMVPSTGGRFPIYRYIHDLNEAGTIDYDIAPAAPTGLVAQQITQIGGTGNITGLDPAKVYEYRNAADSQYTAVTPGTTVIADLPLGEYLVRYAATETEKASVDAIMNMGYLLDEYAVYLDSTGGNDENQGYTQTTAVATFAQAKKQLDILVSYAPAGSTGTIRIVGTYDLGGRQTLPKNTYPLRITGGTLLLTDTNTSNTRRWYRMGGDTTFDNITIKAGNTNTGYYLCGEGYKLTIGKNVTTQIMGNDYIYIMGGTGQYDRAKAVSQAEVVIQSGTWGSVYGGGYVSGITNDVKVTLSDCSVFRLAPSYSGYVDGNVYFTLNNVNVRRELHGGNAGNYSVAGNVTMVLGAGVTCPNIYAGSRDQGNVGGTVTIVADGIDLTANTIYGNAKNTTGTIGGLALELRQGQLANVAESFITRDGVSVKLGCAQTQSVKLPYDIDLDLNGYDLSVDLNGCDISAVGNGALVCSDSKTDDFDVADGEYGAVSAGANLQAAPGYLAVTEDGKTSFHKYEMALTSLIVNTGNSGISYASTFKGDQKVKAQVREFGIAMQAYTAPSEGSIRNDIACKTHVPYLTNSPEHGWVIGDNSNTVKTVFVTNILAEGLSDDDNKERAEVPIYGRSYMILKNGTMLLSEVKNEEAFSMKTAMEHMNSYWNETDGGKDYISSDAKEKLAAFYQKYKSVMTGWNISNIVSAAK